MILLLISPLTWAVTFASATGEIVPGVTIVVAAIALGPEVEGAT